MNNNIYLSLVSNNGKFSYSQTGEMYSKVSSYQIKRWLDKHWDKQEELEKCITKFKATLPLGRMSKPQNNCTKHYIYACIHALMLLERQNKRSLYEVKKYFQQKFIGIKHNGNKALRLLAA